MVDAGPLGGENKVVEVDEIYVGGRARNRNGRVPEKRPVIALVECDGRVRSFHVPNVTGQTLKPIIVENISNASFLTDESPVYPGIGREFAGHGTVNHSVEEYVRAYFWHTNTAEGYFRSRAVFGISAIGPLELLGFEQRLPVDS